MSALKDLTESVTSRYGDRMQKACSHLFDFFGLNQFFYYKICNSGRFVLLDSCAAWSEYYESEKLYLIDPYFRHPRFFQEGVVLLKDVEDQSLKRILNLGKEKFHFGFILKLINKTPDGIEAFGFSSRSSSENQVSLLLSELPLLRLFAKRFREDQQFLFSRLEDNQIDFAKLVGPTFYENSLGIASYSRVREKFLQRLGFNGAASLTAREIGVVKLVLQGYSAGKIASQVFLSKRTVEHHIERIKEKLGCDSKANLIQKARELDLLGCF